MKMMKKAGFRLALTVLISVLSLTFALGAWMLSVSAVDETAFLTITIEDGADKGDIYITLLPSGTREKLESGRTYEQPTGTYYNLEIVPKHSGYTAQWANEEPQLTNAQFVGNAEYRVSFVPATFAVNYVNPESYTISATEKVTSYVYGNETPVSNPTKSGYVLKGWRIYDGDPALSTSNCTVFDDRVDVTLGRDYTPTKDIWLEPIFAEIEYYVVRLDVVYADGAPHSVKEYLGYELISGPVGGYVTGALGTQTQYGGYEYFDSYNYEEKIVSYGYQFGDEAGIAYFKENATRLLEDPTKPNIVLRYYKPIAYPIEVNLNAGDSTVTYVGGGSMPTTHIFDQKTELPTPVRPGYDFLYWEVSYLDGNGQPVSTIQVLPGAETPLKAKECYGEIKVNAIWQVSAPAFTVDYVNEAFLVDGGIPAGRYELSVDGTSVEMVVSADGILANGEAVDRFFIDEAFFGKTVQIKIFGNGSTTHDNYVHLALTARPKIPEYENEILGLSENYTEIKILMSEGLSNGYVYEFAISKDGVAGKNDLVWQESPEFKDLKPGTVYYVFVRVKASVGNYPHGVILREMKHTSYEQYIEQKVNEILALGQEGDGIMVNTLIAEALETLRSKQPSATFYDEVEALAATVKAKMEYARQQDGLIFDLSDILALMKASEAYSGNSVLTLTAIYDEAVGSIKAAAQLSVAQEAYQAAVVALNAVRITYLVSGDLFLTSDKGLPKDTTLDSERNEDTDSVSSVVRDSIKLGEVVVNGTSMTQNEAIHELKSKDVIALYNMKLLAGGGAEFKSFDGKYTIRLLIPEALRDVMGLQIAYYNESTGTVEVLDTERDGDYLIFVATSIDDFVIFGDPTVDLTILMIALGVILLVQLLAIALLFVFRKKKGTLHATAVLPAVALTIRILPGNALLIVMILGVLVALCQVFLTYLLLTTELIRIRPSKQEPESGDASIEAMADAEDLRVEDFEEGRYSSDDFADADDIVAMAYASASAENDDAGEPMEGNEQPEDLADNAASFTFADDSDAEDRNGGADSGVEAVFIEDELAGVDSFEFDDEEDLARGAAEYDEIVPLEDDEIVELDDFDGNSDE